jgi:ATP-dependent Clp protease ATP-binding subunit ClpA
MLAELSRRLKSLGYEVELSPAVPPHLARAGYDPVYGARPLRRALQTQVEDPLAERLLAGGYQKGDTIRITVADGGIAVS